MEEVVRCDATENLFVNALPQDHTRADTSLVYDWSRRESEENRLALIARAFIGAGLGITDVELTDAVVPMASWPSCLVVSFIDLLRQQGIDPEKAIKPQRYCRLVKPLCNCIPGMSVGFYLDIGVSDDGAQLEAETLKAWLTLPTTQEKGQPLIVRRMTVIPAVWFDLNGTMNNIAPLHTPHVFANLTSTNKVKRLLPGDLIVAASLYLGEDHLIPQVVAGTCPQSDIPGTETRYEKGWRARPYINRYHSGVVTLCDDYAGFARAGCGSIGCAWE